MEYDLIIIGGGIFGSFAAKAARLKGLSVLLMDARLGGSGSRAAGCIIRPSWIEALPDEVTDPACSFLLTHYRPRNLIFTVKSSTVAESRLPAYILEPSRILEDAKPLKAVKVGDGWVDAVEVGFGIACGEVLRYTGRVLVAAGVWCNGLIEMPPITALCGSSYIFEGAQAATIKNCGTGRQMAYFTLDNGTQTYFDDDTAIVKSKYKISHDHKTLEIAKEEGLGKATRMNFGMRPFIEVPGQPGCLLRISEKLWVSTGGAKNGCLIGAYQAVKFAEVL